MNSMFPSQYPVACHTSNVGPGTTFVAIKGHKEDGVIYITQALEKGASTIVVEHTSTLTPAAEQAIKQTSAKLIRVANARAALATLSAQALGHPAKKLRIIAITGTKGKTTCSWLLFHILKTAGHKVALLSTVKNFIMDQAFDTNLTTQHPDYLHVFFDACVKAGIEYVVMEVAAQAFSLHRVDTLEFDAALFTNFAQEHAEFYSTLQDYFNAKAAILNHLKPNAPFIINANDPWCCQLATRHNPTMSFGMDNKSTVYAQGIITSTEGLSFTLHHKEQTYPINCPALIGSFNAENCVAIIALALSLGMEIALILQGFLTYTGVPGRLTRYPLSTGAVCFIDYAHNPSSFQAVLPLLKSLTSHLIIVFGCGGDRDRTKRPVMGALAAQWADGVIITTDNPRSEDPMMIVQEIYSGIDPHLSHKVIIELDRKRAIEIAYAQAHQGTIIALLGKGPDEYQQVGTAKSFFSEARIITSLSEGIL